MRGLSFSLAIVSVFSFFSAAVSAGDCGCERPACATCNAKVTIQVCERQPCCRKHHCHHCRQCGTPSSPQSSRGNASPPSGPIHESMGIARSAPMMAMPVMMASYPVMQRAAVYEEPAPPRVRENSCASSASELELLKERFERLHSRVNTLQDSMDTQTTILRKIVDKLDEFEKDKKAAK